LRDREEEIQATGTRVVAIGMGRPEMAAYFRDQFDIPFTLLVDHTKETYRALGIKKGTWFQVSGPQNWPRFVRGILSGKGVAKPQQDPLQMGGVAVVEPGGEIAFIHRSEASSDNLPIDDLLDELR
jgi:hypothetical protein